MTNRNFATTDTLPREIARLTQIMDSNGLDPVYKTFSDFLCDFYPDFSWNPEVAREEAQVLLDSPDWLLLAALVQAKYGFHFETAVRAAAEDDDTLHIPHASNPSFASSDL